MRGSRWLAGSVVVLWGASCLPAADLATLKLIPPQANLIVHVENPRKLAETVIHHDVTQQVLKLPFVSEQIDTPEFERFLHLIRYYEKDLGAPWPELIDKLAGGGMTIAAKAGGENAPFMIVFRGSDEAFTKRFVDRVLYVIEQEQIRADSKERTKKGTHRGIDGWQLAEDALMTRLGSTLLFTNKNQALQAAIDLHLDGGKSLADRSEIAAARKTLPADCHAWLWLDLDIARQSKEAKEQYTFPANDPLQVGLIGGWGNTVIRSQFLLAGLYEEQGSFKLSFRLPAGRNGMPEALALHVPPAGTIGSLPLLEPKGTLYSQSFYFDIRALWELRKLLFNEKIAKDFEGAEKQIAPFLPGTSLSKILTQAGAHHRIVVVNHTAKGYATKPDQILPAFAFVTTFRDPKFAKSFEGVLRAGALVATTQFKMKMNDEMHGGVKIVYYRFDEKAKVDGDPGNVRFNFTPSFATLNDQFIVCSNVELCRELVDLLKVEDRRSPSRSSPAALRGRFYSAGGAEVLKAFEDEVLAQVILNEAVKPQVARKRTGELMQFVRSLGTVTIESEYRDKETRIEIVWKRTGK